MSNGESNVFLALALAATLAACGSRAPGADRTFDGGVAGTSGGAAGTSGGAAGMSGGAGGASGAGSAGTAVAGAGTAGVGDAAAETTTPAADGGDTAPAGKVPIFVAQGDVGRTMVSCDDGQTWVGDHSWDLDGDPLVCGSKAAATCDTGQCSYLVGGQCKTEMCCDDTPDIAKGVSFGGGAFVATWGWGQPGAVRSGTNGIDWTTTHPNDSFGGVAFGGGRFVVASRSPFWSIDGATWTASETADFRNKDGTTMWSVRRFAYADTAQGGRFVAVASGDTDRDMLVSSDGGQTWWRPTTIPDACALDVSTYGGIVAGNGVIVIVDQHANACRSTDGGKTWTVTPTGLTQVLSHGVWTGSEFWFWGDDAYLISSADGATWTKTRMATPTRLGPVARGPSGTLVALGSVWDGYAKQQFWRSTDGLTWTALPKSAFVQSHPIFYIAFGYADASAACPAR